MSSYIKIACDAPGCPEHELVIAASQAQCADYARAVLGWSFRQGPETTVLCYCRRHAWLGLPLEPFHPKE